MAGSGFQGGLAAVRLGDGRDDGKAEPASPALGAWPAPVRRIGAGRPGAAGTIICAIANRGAGCGPVATPLGTAVEPVECPGGVVSGHARAAVCDLQHYTAADLGEPHRRGSGHRRVLADVAQQVGQHLPDARLVHGSDQ
jgi:hypothetical protein